MNTPAENSISYQHMFVVVCYQTICQLGSKEHLHAFSDCKENKLKRGEGGSTYFSSEDSLQRLTVTVFVRFCPKI